MIKTNLLVYFLVAISLGACQQKNKKIKGEIDVLFNNNKEYIIKNINKYEKVVIYDNKNDVMKLNIADTSEVVTLFNEILSLNLDNIVKSKDYELTNKNSTELYSTTIDKNLIKNVSINKSNKEIKSITAVKMLNNRLFNIEKKYNIDVTNNTIDKIEINTKQEILGRKNSDDFTILIKKI